jgi:exonuclease VII small subunit
LGLDLGGFDLEIKDQNEKIAQLRRKDAEIDQYLNLLERGHSLDEEGQLKLAQEVYDLLGR